MITPEQQKWLDHLKDNEFVIVAPFDPTSEEKFLQVKKQIQNILGKEQDVLHRGASSLKISGQNEIDVYIPVPQEKFDETVVKIIGLYGKPRSNYALKRARFVVYINEKHVDVFVINKDDDNWKDSEIFHNHLLNNPSALEEYRILKEKAVGKSFREYYTIKTEFINKILESAKYGKT